LREALYKIMLGESDTKFTVAEFVRFKALFKLDNGRRVFTYMLKEYAQSVADGDVFLISPISFDMLKSLVELCLEQLDLSNGADYISGKHLLETSSLIGQLKENKQIDFIQSYIKPHKCWQNTFFWEEFFWSQTTTKYEEAFGGLSTDPQLEHDFFAKEITNFVKVIWGWGNLTADSIALFVESLAVKCGLPLEQQTLLAKSVNQFVAKVTAQPSARTRLITKASAPRAQRERLKTRARAKVEISEEPESETPRSRDWRRTVQRISSKILPDTSKSSGRSEKISSKSNLEPTAEEVMKNSAGNRPRSEIRKSHIVDKTNPGARTSRLVPFKDDVASFIDNMLGVEALTPKE